MSTYENERRRFVAHFDTSISLAVTVGACDEEQAADLAWQKAEEYLQTLGNHRDILADATLDGIGAGEIEPLDGSR